jgi:AbiV family abortive infection protein
MLRQAAAACFKNAQSHYEAAKLLVKHDYSSQAVALAVIGVEEFAKALVYAVAALMLSQRKDLPDKIGNHHLKHRVASLAAGARAMLSEGLAEGGYSRQERLALYPRFSARADGPGLLAPADRLPPWAARGDGADRSGRGRFR